MEYHITFNVTGKIDFVVESDNPIDAVLEAQRMTENLERFGLAEIRLEDNIIVS